jgi:hypothetical protein
MEDMREEQLVLKEAQWADDKDVIACRNCTKPFSVSRRKVSPRPRFILHESSMMFYSVLGF